ncbi:MAG TPA: class I SAM-dependent methyltransferase [Candidatus Acidoferrum sp.]|nr:class I SAM-dependent methyltransferase [Candidatus Acidoferrum sp.]
MTRKRVLPWLLSGTELGEHVLEIGAGAGAATEELRKRAGRVTSLEYSHELAVKLARRNFRGPGNAFTNGDVLRGDASALPFSEKTFSALTAVLMLHHLKSTEAQEAAFAEAFRVLRPGGVFIAIDIPDGWLHRVAHIRSTFVPIAPSTAPARLAAAGFSDVSMEFRGGAFRLRALRPRDADKSQTKAR